MIPPLIEYFLPYQRQFLLSPKKRKIWVAARQIGKSQTCAALAMLKALEKRNGLSLVISTGARASSEFLLKVVNGARALEAATNGKLQFTSSSDCVKFSTGSRILSLPSGNPAALRGFSASCVIVDEAQYIDNPDEVMAAIAPTLTRDREAELILASTPAGKNGFFWDMLQQAKSDDRWYVQTTSIYDAYEQGLEVDIEQLKSLCPDPDIWRMEYLAEFLDEFGSFIDTELLQFSDDTIQKTKAAYMGFDVGSTSDRSVIVDLVQLPDDTYFVRDAITMHRAEYSHQLQVLKELNQAKKWNAGYVDANGIGSMLAETATKQVSAKIRGYTWTGTNKTPAYEALRALVFDNKIRFASHLKKLVVQDFQNVSRVVSESGQIKYIAGRDANGHSDLTSALVLAVQAAKQHPTTFSTPVPFGASSSFGSWRSRI